MFKPGASHQVDLGRGTTALFCKVMCDTFPGWFGYHDRRYLRGVMGLDVLISSSDSTPVSVPREEFLLFLTCSTCEQVYECILKMASANSSLI